MHLAVSPVQRIAPESVDPSVKNSPWLDLVMGLLGAYDRGANNVVLTDGAGHVVEGPGFNIFVVRNGRVATPERGMLQGITRETAMSLLADLQVVTEIRDRLRSFRTPTKSLLPRLPAASCRSPALTAKPSGLAAPALSPDV